MEAKVVGLLGTAAKHILHSMRRAFIAISITGLLVALIAAAATEVIASVLTRSFPTGPTHLAAAAIGVAFGYAAAMTVAIAEILRAMIIAIELIVKESEKVAEQAAREAEVLARKAEDDAIHLGRATLGDAEAVGRGAAGAAGGVLGGVARDVRGIEHGIDAHLPGHHNDAAPVTVAPAATPSSTSTYQS